MGIVNTLQDNALREFRNLAQFAEWRDASDAKIDALIADPEIDFITEADRDSLELQETASLRHKLRADRDPRYAPWPEIFRRHMAANY